MITKIDIKDYSNDNYPQPTGDRYNKGKLKWSLIPQSALEPMVRQAEYGAQKYSAWNWTKGLSVTEICESLKRHLDAFMEGNDIDDEGLPHIGGIQWNAMALNWMLVNKPEFDDRYSKLAKPVSSTNQPLERTYHITKDYKITAQNDIK